MVRLCPVSAIQIHKGTPPSVIKQLTGLQRKVNALKNQENEVVSLVERSVASTGAGFALGYLEGRYGRDSIGEIPIAPLGFAAFHVAGFFGPSDWAPNLHAAGDGCSTVYGYKSGLEIGRDRKAKVEQKAQAPQYPVYPGT